MLRGGYRFAYAPHILSDAQDMGLSLWDKAYTEHTYESARPAELVGHRLFLKSD